jgi:hypothetical protein
MITKSIRAQSNLKLILDPNSVLYNLLTGDDCKDISKVVYLRDLKTSLNDLLSIDQHIHENPSYKNLELVNIFIGKVLNEVLECLPSFIGGWRIL